VCGSGNLVKNCESAHNGDTGILLCAYPGEDREKWPSYNRIEDCDSYEIEELSTDEVFDLCDYVKNVYLPERNEDYENTPVEER
jgi:hypothetical protein